MAVDHAPKCWAVRFRISPFMKTLNLWEFLVTLRTKRGEVIQSPMALDKRVFPTETDARREIIHAAMDGVLGKIKSVLRIERLDML